MMAVMVVMVVMMVVAVIGVTAIVCERDRLDKPTHAIVAPASASERGAPTSSVYTVHRCYIFHNKYFFCKTKQQRQREDSV